MDTNKFAELLKKYNKGVFRGSKRKLAKELGCNETTISNISSGRANPSEELLKAMSKVLKTKENILQEIFSTTTISNFSEKENSLINENKLLKDKIKFLEEKNSFLEKQIAFFEKQFETQTNQKK